MSEAPTLPAWKLAQREPVPLYHIASLREATGHVGAKSYRQRPIPTAAICTRKDGIAMRYWTDGSLRRA